jgi:hypothetical protein
MSLFSLVGKVFSLLFFALAVAFISLIGWSAKKDQHSGWFGFSLSTPEAHADVPSGGSGSGSTGGDAGGSCSGCEASSSSC